MKEVKILDKYTNFVDIFLKKRALVLWECTKFNKHVINLKNNKQPPYELIYSLDLVELEILKTYIKTHLKTGFIQSSKSSADTSILFHKKLNCSFFLYINYQGFNNLIINNKLLVELRERMIVYCKNLYHAQKL